MVKCEYNNNWEKGDFLNGLYGIKDKNQAPLSNLPKL